VSPRWPDPLDGPGTVEVEQWIDDALDRLGIDSDQVAAALMEHVAAGHWAGTDDDPVCLYLQWAIDPSCRRVLIDECDVMAVSYQVLNPDECTWSRGVAALPGPVWVFNVRADDGDFPALSTALMDRAG
jgi:hypothetical protein